MPENDGAREPLLVTQLAEVFLLLDYISGTAAANLPDLNADPIFASPSGESWIQQICAIRWPTPIDSPQTEAANATKLLRVKDALNATAYPASGASVAYTLLMTGEAGGKGMIGTLRDAFRTARPSNVPTTDMDPRDRLSVSLSTSRSSLAKIAYPNLAIDAHKWRWTYPLLVLFLIVALVVTCWTSWRVATGSSMLNRVTALTTEQRSVVASATEPAPTRQGSAAPIAGSADFGPRLRVAADNLSHYMTENRRLAQLVGGQNQAILLRYDGKPATNLEWAAVFIGVLAGTVLPICYGVLGAAAAVVRNISTRMGASTLTPRSLRLSLVQLGLGAVIGACVGLFVTSDGNAATDGGLLGQVRLSTSALCFLAGFGVEGVFRALEALVGRVFPAGSAPATTSRPPARS